MKNPENLSIYRKLTDYKCDLCEARGVNKRMIILQDDLWEEVANRIPESQRNFYNSSSPVKAFLCVDCIEKLLGRKIKKEDLKIKNGEFVPGNYWWIKENGLVQEFIPEIKKSIQGCSEVFIKNLYPEELLTTIM